MVALTLGRLICQLRGISPDRRTSAHGLGRIVAASRGVVVFAIGRGCSAGEMLSRAEDVLEYVVPTKEGSFSPTLESRVFRAPERHPEFAEKLGEGFVGWMFPEG